MKYSKPVFLLLAFFLFIGLGKAQYHAFFNRGLTEFHAGMALPTFDFGSGSATQLSDHANLGLNIGGSVAYFYSRQVALEFDVNYNRNGVNADKLADAYFNTDTLNNLSASASAGSFQDVSGVIGFRFDLAFNEYFSFVFKMGGGLRLVYKPEATIQLKSIAGTHSFAETSDTQVLFALSSSMGARIKVTDQMDVHFGATYMGSKIDFEYQRNGLEVIEKDHLGIIMFNVGVGYSF